MKNTTQEIVWRTRGRGNGSAGNDTLISGSRTGPSTSSGQANATCIRAGNGTQYIVGGDGNDSIYGGNGSDTIYAGDGNTIIRLSSNATENGWVYGGNGSDTIYGGAGNDLISAGDGGTTAAATEIHAGSGSSMIYGGAGVDLFVRINCEAANDFEWRITA